MYRRGLNIIGCFLSLWCLEAMLVTLLVHPQYSEFPKAPLAEFAFITLMVSLPAGLTYLVDRNGKTFVTQPKSKAVAGSRNPKRESCLKEISVIAPNATANNRAGRFMLSEPIFAARGVTAGRIRWRRFFSNPIAVSIDVVPRFPLTGKASQVCVVLTAARIAVHRRPRIASHSKPELTLERRARGFYRNFRFR